jgi:hypothetical protein
MMYLNGTSMAAPVVSGAAALLLQANPQLTPNLVKAILMYTAQQLPGFNTLEQGAGELNIEGAVRLAKLVRTDLRNDTPLGAPLLKTLTPPVPQTTIAGYTFPWSQGILLDHAYATGTDLITEYQKVYGTGVVLSDGVILSDNGGLSLNLTVMSSGVIVGDELLVSTGATIGVGTQFLATGVFLGDGVILGDGTSLTDGVIVGDGVILGDGTGTLLNDAVLQAQSATAQGDDTSCMAVQPDDGTDFLDY